MEARKGFTLPEINDDLLMEVFCSLFSAVLRAFSSFFFLFFYLLLENWQEQLHSNEIDLDLESKCLKIVIISLPVSIPQLIES